MLDWSELNERLASNPVIELRIFEVGPPVSTADLDLWEESYGVALPLAVRSLYAQGDGADVLWLAREGCFEAGRLRLPELSGRVRLQPIAELLDDADTDPLWRNASDPSLRLLDVYGHDFPDRQAIGLRIESGGILPELLLCDRPWGAMPLRLGGRPFDLSRYLAWTSRIAGFRGWPNADLSPAHQREFVAAVAAVFGAATAAWVEAELTPSLVA